MKEGAIESIEAALLPRLLGAARQASLLLSQAEATIIFTNLTYPIAVSVLLSGSPECNSHAISLEIYP